MTKADHTLLAIDTVVNPHTSEIVEMRPEWSGRFHKGKFGRDDSVMQGYSYEEIATELGVSRPNAAVILCRGRKKVNDYRERIEG